LVIGYQLSVISVVTQAFADKITHATTKIPVRQQVIQKSVVKICTAG
jgi:hypothetical protein